MQIGSLPQRLCWPICPRTNQANIFGGERGANLFHNPGTTELLRTLRCLLACTCGEAADNVALQ